MAAITDTRAIAFSNTVVRPRAEALRAIIADLRADSTQWFAGINALFPNDSSIVTDNRGAEGVSVLTGQDVNSLMSVAAAIIAASNDQIISKPCVRAFNAS